MPPQQAPQRSEPHAAEATVPAARAPSGAALVARDVTKRWRGRGEPVLDGVDLDLGTGTITWIAGRNGTGKTTLLRIIGGLIAADRGAISLRGVDLDRDPRSYRARTGMLSAGNSGLFARLSARRHLEYWARLAFVPRDKRGDAIERMIDAFELDDFAARRVDRLSLGQRQRVRAAMTFLHEPHLVLLDEPQTSLDGEGVAMLTAAIAQVTARGATVIWCSPMDDHPALAFDHRFEMRGSRLERQ